MIDKYIEETLIQLDHLRGCYFVILMDKLTLYVRLLLILQLTYLLKSYGKQSSSLRYFLN